MIELDDMCKQWKMRGREALSWKDECAGKRARRGSMEGKDRDRRRSRRARLAGRQESDDEQVGARPTCRRGRRARRTGRRSVGPGRGEKQGRES